MCLTLFCLVSQGSLNNSTCFIGPHRVHSPWSNTFFDLTPGQGHFGPDALPGDARCAALRRTQLPFWCAFVLVTHVCLRSQLAPRRVGLARVGAQRDGRHRGGGPRAAGLPEALSVGARSSDMPPCGGGKERIYGHESVGANRGAGEGRGGGKRCAPRRKKVFAFGRVL